jgi:DNA-binding NarL/FixJ family response regulator
VLQLVARGMTNADIGQQLFISEATVKTHLLRAFGKLGVSEPAPHRASFNRYIPTDLLSYYGYGFLIVSD